MGSLPILVRVFLCPYNFHAQWLSCSLGYSAKVWIECCQQDFGIYPLHGKGSLFSFTWKTDDAKFMESSVSFLGKTINNWFTYIQRQGTTNLEWIAQVDVGMYDTVLKPLIDYSGEISLFIIILLSILKECEKSRIYTPHLLQKVFLYSLAWVLKKSNRKP